MMQGENLATTGPLLRARQLEETRHMNSNVLQIDSLIDDGQEVLGALFDRIPMGIAVLDRDFVVRQCNSTWVGFIHHYTRYGAGPISPGVRLFQIAPGIEHTVLPIFNRVLSGEAVQQEALELETDGIVSYWDATIAPLTH